MTDSSNFAKRRESYLCQWNQKNVEILFTRSFWTEFLLLLQAIAQNQIVLYTVFNIYLSIFWLSKKNLCSICLFLCTLFCIEYCARAIENCQIHMSVNVHISVVLARLAYTHANTHHTPIVRSCFCLENEYTNARRTKQSKAKQNKIIYTHINRKKRESEDKKVLAIKRDKRMDAILTSKLQNMPCKYCGKETASRVRFSCVCVCICIHSVI